jgi:hypothetical protein
MGIKGIKATKGAENEDFALLVEFNQHPMRDSS